MITPEATYARVAEAAEAALDSFMVKPFSANSLFERLQEARQRKRVLKDIFEAMESKNFELAADLCLQRFNQRLQAFRDSGRYDRYFPDLQAGKYMLTDEEATQASTLSR